MSNYSIEVAELSTVIPNVSPSSSTIISENVDHVSTKVVSSTVPVFVLIAVLALSGNLLVVFLFVRNRSWLKKTHSNLILTLAITDILTALCILCVPLFVHDERSFPVPSNTIARELYCRVFWSHYLVFSLGVTSVYLCLSLAVERWLAVRKPYFYKQNLQSKRVIAVMVLLPWLAGFAFEASAIVRTTGVVFADGTTTCRWSPDTSEWSTRVGVAVVTFCGMILLPGLLVVATYAHILFQVRKNLKHTSQRTEEIKKRESLDFKRITLMAGLSSIVLVTCWLPGQFYFMLSQIGYAEVHGIVHRWLNVLALSSSCWNPLIYSFLNPQYREGFKKELLGILCCLKLARSKPRSMTSRFGEPSLGAVVHGRNKLNSVRATVTGV